MHLLYSMPSSSSSHRWSLKYKRSINCRHPRGFSQKQHCKYGRKGWKTAVRGTRRIKLNRSS